MMVRWRVQGRRRGALRLAAWIFGVAATGLTAFGCSAKTDSARARTTSLPTELRIGMTPNYPPLVTKGDDGKMRGMEVDFANLLAKQLDLKVTLIEMPWEELLPALVDDKIDVIMSGMSITPARAQFADFTVPYMPIGQMAMVRKTDLPRLREQEALDQPTSRVGVIQNTTGDYFARGQLKNAKVVGFVSVDEGIAALRNDQVDFFLSDAPTVWELTSRRKPENADLAGIYRPLTTEYLAWAVRQDDDALRQQLNATVLQWAQNGQLEDIIDDWVRTRRVTLQVK